MTIKHYNIFTVIIAVALLLFSSGLNGRSSTDIASSYRPAFGNEHLLYELFDKLQDLKSLEGKKVNIVHLGDSHIQADFFTNTVRQQLQEYFGNGGYGFTFPYSIAKTNGTRRIKYSTNIDWEVARNVDKFTDLSIGLGGIALLARTSGFFITLISDTPFNRIKVLSSKKDPNFLLSNTLSFDETVSSISPKQTSTQTVYHKVKSGETLFRLSVNYKVSVDEIKKANRLSSNTIKVGQNIRIPQKNIVHATPVLPASATRINSKDTLRLVKGDYYVEYNSAYPISEISIVADKNKEPYNLNGIVIENASASGIIYHGIGINGAKASDFNKYSLFFEQLSVLTPDLVIVSLGTNESFGRLSSTNFMNEIESLVKNIRQKHPGIPVIISTPPPSLFKRRLTNTFLIDYVKQIMAVKDCSVWDLYSKAGGANAPKRKSVNTLMAKDKIHYTQEGYRQQANILASDFIKAYENYIKVKSSVEHEIKY